MHMKSRVVGILVVNWRSPPVLSGGCLRLQTIAEAPSGLSSEMSSIASTPTTEPVPQAPNTPPKRADARRNYDKVVAAARDAFAERGASTSLEEIARRAEVGIGTLYRNFPNRQALLEAVYVEELDGVCCAAAALDGADPWADFVEYIHGLVGYLATKQALAHELLEYVDRDASFFPGFRGV